MNDIEMRECLRNWIEKFIRDESEKKYLSELVEQESVPVKSILASLTPYFDNTFDGNDRDLLDTLVYYYI